MTGTCENCGCETDDAIECIGVGCHSTVCPACRKDRDLCKHCFQKLKDYHKTLGSYLDKLSS